MHVFFATDGSRDALAAEQLLAEFPFRERPQLTVATVYPAADPEILSADVGVSTAALMSECRTAAQQTLREAVDRCRHWTASTTELLLDGHAADELLRSIEQIKPDLVVCGARGLGAVRRFLLGSVSERLVKHARVSTLVVHPPVERSDVRNILIAHDGSPEATAAVERFAAFPLSTETQIHLLGVIETVHAYGVEVLLEGMGTIDARRKEIGNDLAAAAKRFRGRIDRVATEVHTSSDVAGTILDVAAQHQADLIVVGSRGKSAWDRFLLGSTSLRVLHHAPCSVWIERAVESTPHAPSTDKNARPA